VSLFFLSPCPPFPPLSLGLVFADIFTEEVLDRSIAVSCALVLVLSTMHPVLPFRSVLFHRPLSCLLSTPLFRPFHLRNLESPLVTFPGAPPASLPSAAHPLQRMFFFSNMFRGLPLFLPGHSFPCRPSVFFTFPPTIWPKSFFFFSPISLFPPRCHPLFFFRG